MRILVALGGRALLPQDGSPAATQQHQVMDSAAAALAEVAREHQLVVVPGLRPRPGPLATYVPDSDTLLDVLDAASAGMVGDLVAELGDRLPPGRRVVTVGTGIPVRPDHPDPLEPVPVLLGLGHVVVCGSRPIQVGGHVVRGEGARADEDAASALLAQRIGADLLVIATDVAGVYEGWGTPAAHCLHLVDIIDLDPASLQPGSMGPKVEAAGRFARAGGRSVIGALADLPDLVAGRAGTRVVDSSALVGHARPWRPSHRATRRPVMHTVP
jgi:carbamate kinase